MIQIVLQLIVAACFIILCGCHEGIPPESVLFDFESDSDLDRVHWKCHSLFHLSDKHVSHGTKSLHLELYPSEYPGFSPNLVKDDWQGYKSFCFDVYNPGEKELQITVRIDDREDAPEYPDRYNRSFTIKPGMNRIRIPLDSLVTSGTRRKLDLNSIHQLIIFMVNPALKVDLYIDYGHLVS